MLLGPGAVWVAGVAARVGGLVGRASAPVLRL